MSLSNLSNMNTGKATIREEDEKSTSGDDKSTSGGSNANSDDSPHEVSDADMPETSKLYGQEFAGEVMAGVPPRNEAARPGAVARLRVGVWWFGHQALLAFRAAVYLWFVVLTVAVLSIRSSLAFVFSGKPADVVLERPGRLLSPEILDGAEDLAEAVRQRLPVPPPLPELPEEGITISFGPCANLMIYIGGVAACLQRCPNYKESKPRLRFYGCSCGAVIASMMAGDIDMLGQVAAMWAWTDRFQCRLWGLIGAYSSSIAPILRQQYANPEKFDAARSRLAVGATALNPVPEHVVEQDFETPEELVSAVLGSCYIPVAFEEPQWSRRNGPLLDGGILGFQVKGDVVVSPYRENLPDIGPEVPHPRSLVFFPPNRADAVALLEDGYNDCLAWLAAGAPMTMKDTREAEFQDVAGIGPLVAESWRFFREVACGKAQKD